MDGLYKILSTILVRGVMGHAIKFSRKEFFVFIKGVGTKQLQNFLRRLTDWYLYHPTHPSAYPQPGF